MSKQDTVDCLKLEANQALAKHGNLVLPLKRPESAQYFEPDPFLAQKAEERKQWCSTSKTANAKLTLDGFSIVCVIKNCRGCPRCDRLRSTAELGHVWDAFLLATKEDSARAFYAEQYAPMSKELKAGVHSCRRDPSGGYLVLNTIHPSIRAML